jgi:hypothetical protein
MFGETFSTIFATRALTEIWCSQLLQIIKNELKSDFEFSCYFANRWL